MTPINRAAVAWAKQHSWFVAAFPRTPDLGWQVEVISLEPVFDVKTGEVVGHTGVHEFFHDLQSLRNWAGY